MCPVSNRPTRLYKTAKTHKLGHSQDVTREDIKFPLIINQTGTDTNNAAKVISNYLKHLCTNEYTINDKFFLKFYHRLKKMKGMFHMM